MDNLTLRPAWRNWWGAFFVAPVLLLLFIVAGIGVASTSSSSTADLATPLSLAAVMVVWMLSGVWGRFSHKYEISVDRITQHEGIIARRQNSLRAANIRSVQLSQGLVQRIFGVGNLEFYSAGDRAEVRFIGVHQPVMLRDRIESMIGGGSH